MVILTLALSLILDSQTNMLHKTPTEEEQSLVQDTDSVAGNETRRIGLAVDVAGHDAIQVTPADDEAESDTPCVYTLEIVRGPGNSVGDAGIDAKGCDVHASILDGRVGRRNKHCEPDYAEGGHDHIDDA